MSVNRFGWMIGGKAGFGIMITGQVFAKACSRGGLNVFSVVEYPSLIKGGHNSFHVRVEEEEIHSHIELIDILVALNKETVDKHKDKITEGGVIIFDSSETKIDRGEVRDDINLCDVPLLKIAKDVSGERLMMNTVSLGASFGVVNYDFRILEEVLRDTFSKKGVEVVSENISAARQGFDFVKDKFKGDFKIKLDKIIVGKKMLLTGNDAICLGAIRAGCKFYSAYPMTPSSPILHYMAAHELSKDVVVKQTEDEISAIHAAIGASFAGVRSMVATSGGGFCLMTEALGLAGITETPLVIVMGQRAGPSTGLATRTEQADLKFVLNASQGEFPRIVLSPGDVDECFYLTLHAFNIAERYQVQVIILTDKHLVESYKTTKPFNTDYKVDRGLLLSDKDLENISDFKRFQITESGVSPRTVPGQKNGIFRVPSYEHDESGWNIERPDIRKAMVDKRMRKLDSVLREIPDPKVYGDKDADISIVSWGSTKGAILEAMKFLKNDGVKVNFLHFNYINPFKVDFVKKFLGSAKKTMIVEQNKTLQLAGVIKENICFSFDYSFSKYDGRQMFPHEVYNKVKEVLID